MPVIHLMHQREAVHSKAPENVRTLQNMQQHRNDGQDVAASRPKVLPIHPLRSLLSMWIMHHHLAEL